MPRPATTRSTAPPARPAKPSAKAAVPALQAPPTRKQLAVEVNTASQTLSAIVKANWKAGATTARTDTTLAEATGAVRACRAGLAALRAMVPGDLDVERSAVAILGKVVAIELFGSALDLATDIRPALAALYHPVEPATPPPPPPPTAAAAVPAPTKTLKKPSRPAAVKTKPAAPAAAPAPAPALASLPVPSPQSAAPDGVLALVIAHYLVHTLAAAARVFDAHALAALVASRGTLLDWHPFLAAHASPAQLVHFMRAPFQYVPKAIASSDAPPGVLFRIRTWTLECLLTLAELDHDGFWNQSIIFANTYTKAVATEDETLDACRSISTTFSTLVRVVQTRQDATDFIGAKSFAHFSQRWMQYAKKISDLDTLNHISRLMDATSLASSQSTAGVEKVVAKICVAALQAAELMERFPAALQDPSLLEHLHRVTSLLATWLRAFNLHGAAPADEQMERVSRALNKLRRVCVDSAEMWGSSAAELRAAVLGALASVVECIEAVQTRWERFADMTNGAIDALVVMARAAVREQAGIQPAYAHLERALRIARARQAADGDATLAQRLRVVSAALWLHGGTLYKDSLYGHAALFLKTSCDVARDALSLAAAESTMDIWRELQDQLSKRFELHGVCCFKFGDRKVAWQSYCEALRERSFAVVADMAPGSPTHAIFTSTGAADLATLLERMTWLGAGELLVPGSDLSARALSLRSVEADVVGALIEWQIAVLESGSAKEHIRTVRLALCEEALLCYDEARHPIRRSRVLLQQLEQIYSCPATTQDWKGPYDQVKRLLSVNDFRDDVALKAYCAQYLATAHVWAGLLVHRDAGSEALVVQYLQDAANALQDMLGLRKVEARRPSVGTVPVATKSKSVATTRSTRSGKAPASKDKPPAAAKKPATKTKATTAVPVTPRPPRAAVKKTIPSPRASTSKVVLAPVRDNWQRLFSLLRMAAQLLGLLGQYFVRIQFLKLMRHLSAEVSLCSDEFVRSSLDLASQYAALGLVDRTLEVLGRARVALFGENPEELRDIHVPPSALGVELLLLSSRMLAEMNESELSILEYRKAANMADALDNEQPSSTSLRIRDRALQLERSAMACGVFATIELSRDNPYSAAAALTQAFRLWNRAADTLSRLNQPPPPPPPPKQQNQNQKRESNPFDMSDLRDALGEITNGPATNAAAHAPPLLDNPTSAVKQSPSRTSMFEGLQWRVAEGLLSVVFQLSRMYYLRGSAREAQFFVTQALDLAQSLGASAVQARALARKAEILLYTRELTQATASLAEAEALLQSVHGVDVADLHRLHGLCLVLQGNEKDGRDMFSRALAVMNDLGQQFVEVENEISSPKRTKAVAKASSPLSDARSTLSPLLLASILRHQIWLLRDRTGDYQAHLSQFSALLQAFDVKGEHTSLMAKLSVHAANMELGSDLFLSSLADSTIAIPMRVTSDLSSSTRDILKSFSTAETLLLSTLEINFERGHICQVREAAVSLASISALQASLGRKADTAGHVAAGLLNLASAITLERELLDSIQVKINDFSPNDDLVWPTFDARGNPIRKVAKPKQVKKRYAYSDDEFDDEDEDASASLRTLNSYWNAVRERHRPLFSQAWQPKEDVDELPLDWTIVSISVAEDKKSLFISRQRPKAEPLVFCVPLERHNRREEDDDEEERFTYHDAVEQLDKILRESRESTQQATLAQDLGRAAKAEWWATRSELDNRLRQLLDNIEYCWLGAFKTVLNESLPLCTEAVETLRSKFETVFARNLVSKGKDKRQFSKLALNPSLVECFLTLEPTCRDEEIEDLVYFMLDLYQFNGVSVAAHDIDVDNVVIDVRTLLDECAAKSAAVRRAKEDDSRRKHLFLVLDKNVQGIPWESIPVLRGRAVSRIPSIAFLMDRVQLSRTLTSSTPSQKARKPVVSDRALVNPARTTYILNPSGDLMHTQRTFSPWVKDMEDGAGWDGITGRAPSELELVNALTKKDLVIYFGHGGAEQFIRSHKIRNLPRCAATMLWGCSSGALRDMGEFDRTGTPDSYMLGGCPTLVANLWDVTDRDLDRLSKSVFDQLRLEPSRAPSWNVDDMDGREVSVVAAVAKARDACKLKYLTGAATVVYGIPFYC